MLFIISLLPVSNSFALNPYSPSQNTNAGNKMEEMKEKMEEKKTEIQEKKDEIVQKRCDIVTKRIDNRISTFYDRKEYHVYRYKTVKERVVNLVARLEDEGYDVTELKEKLQTLDEKIKEAAVLYENFIASLESAKDFECGKSEGSFAGAVQKSSTEIKTFRDKMIEIREYFTKEIRPLLEEIKKEILNNKQAETEESTSSE